MFDAAVLKIDDVIETFEAAWRAGHNPSARAYLERVPDRDRPELLRELVRAELEYRLRGGQAACVEDCLAAHPELATDPTTVVELIVLEYRARRTCGHAVRPTEYVARFPAYRAELGPRLAALTDGPPDVPGYELLEEIGRGGMGVVYRARDTEFGRPVAVKVMGPRTGHASAARRFRTEARVTGRLQHPGVPPAHRLGTLLDGNQFFVMKLIAGRTFAQLLAEGRDRPRDLHVFEQVCQTVAYAHREGVVHRDLKPANVMVGEFGEVQVLDWGLARDEGRGTADEETNTGAADPHASFVPGPSSFSTQAGDVMGTPAYMSPEQANGDPDRVGPATDVFALGAILCEILTGGPAYTDRHDALQAARSARLGDAHERLTRCGADPELVALARACLTANTEDRPGDAGAVAGRVTAYRHGVDERLRAAERQQAALRATAVEQRKRRRVYRWLTAAVVLLLFGGGAFGWYADHKATERRAEQATRAETGRTAIDASLVQAERSLRADKPTEAGIALADARRRFDADPHADADGSRAKQLDSLQRQHDLLVQLDRVRDLQRGARRDGAAGGGAPSEAFDAVGAREQFPVVFREFGVDLSRPDDAAALIRGWAIREQATGALDLWLFVDHNQAGLKECLAALDPDPDRNAWRAALGADLETRMLAIQRLDKKPHPPRFLAAHATVWPPMVAVPLLRVAWNRTPDNLPLSFALATLLARGSDPARHDEIIGYYRACLAARPGHTASLVNLGVRLFAKRDLDGSIACLEQAASGAPGHALARFNLGFAYHMRGRDPRRTAGEKKADTENAKAHYRETITIAPAFARAHTNLGALLQDRGDIAGAIASFEAALTHDPNDTNARLNLDDLRKKP